MTALLFPDEAARLRPGEQLVIVRAGDPRHVLSAFLMPVGSVCGPCRREGHRFTTPGDADGWGPLEGCPCCFVKHSTLFVAPQAWVALTGPCPSQTKHSDDGRLLVAYDSYGEPLYGDSCPDCRDGRRIVPLYAGTCDFAWGAGYHWFGHVRDGVRRCALAPGHDGPHMPSVDGLNRDGVLVGRAAVVSIEPEDDGRNFRITLDVVEVAT